MFKLAEKNEVLWPVTIHVPDDNGPRDVTVKVRYKLLKKTEARRIAGLAADEIDDALLDHITGWEGFCDLDGNPLEFSKENLRAAMEYQFIEYALAKGWREASAGAPVKN